MNNIKPNQPAIARFVLTGLFGLLCFQFAIAVTPTDLRCQYRVDPLGIDTPHPRLSWKIVDPDNVRGQKQSAYQVLVASSVENCQQDEGDLWDSQWIPSSQSVNNRYAGKTLTSGQPCFWKVRVEDRDGKRSDWSPIARFTIGLLEPQDWKGKWIQKADQTKLEHNWYRKNISLSETPKSGFVYVASLGYHEIYINGEKITDNVMNPVSSYWKTRVPYLTYDVSDVLKEGKNVVAIWHAAGWSRWTRIREHRKIPYAFKAQIEIETEKQTLSLGSDETWKCAKSHSEYVGDWDILDFGGELIDARRIVPDWNMADFDDTAWDDAVEATGKFPKHLSAQMVEPQVKYETIKPAAITKNDDGSFLVDMGVNYSGFFEIDLRGGTAGEKVVIQISDIQGVACNKKQQSEYVFGESGQGTFANRFNLSGGRWFTIAGLGEEPVLEDIRGFVITCDRKRISRFESSNDLLNQIYEINIRTYIANTLDGILMDCPHRERRGWGEVTVAAMYGDAFPNFETGAYMDQYIQYMHDAQFPDGRNRAVINEEDRPFLMWQANNPITVWETYRNFGDKRVLEVNYEPMQKWMDWILANSRYQTGGSLKPGEPGKREFPGLGDWATPHGNNFESCNSPDANHFNNCLYAYMLDIAHKIAVELGKTDDAAVFADRLAVQRKASHSDTYDPSTGEYQRGLQVDQIYAIISGVAPPNEQQKVYDNLVDKILYDFPYYDTGSSGQALYTRYFIEHGERMDLIYELLTDTRHPSYSYFIECDETTWPELWSSLGGSRIHTCYTGIGGYFIGGFAGIRVDPEDVGFQRFLIKPAVVGDLSEVNASHQSLYGNIVSHWKRSGKSATFHLEIPPNTTAKVYIPATDPAVVKEGGVMASRAEGVELIGTEKNDAVGQYVIYQVIAGVYDFSSANLPPVDFAKPKYRGDNLALIGRATASSMTMLGVQNPGQEAFRANDNDPQTIWKARQPNDQWLEIEWIKPQSINRFVIHEQGSHITDHKIQFWDADRWVDLAEGTVCGDRKEHRFETVTAKRCRVYIERASNRPSISEIEISGTKR